MYNALVIGCGNIGALYDFDNEQIQTHVKAYHLDPRFSLSIFDTNNAIVAKVSDKYKCKVVDVINKEILKNFDCISICTPTDTHIKLLELAIKSGVKVIICEKPISNIITDIRFIKSLLSKGKSKILVNYFRRFQPSFIDLKETINKLVGNEMLTNINIKYQRGFLNNCSHAFDTLEFLTDSRLDLSEIKIHNKIFDHFKDDPTISLQAKWKDTNLSVTGLSNIRFSHFELDLYYEYYKIYIKNAGQNIEIYKADKGDGFLQPLKIQEYYTREKCLVNYMKHVILNAFEFLKNSELEDNFIQSVDLNERMLNYIKN